MAMTKQTRLPRKIRGSRVEFTMQSIRLSKADNRKLKAEARRQRKSFNLWAVEVLTEALAKAVKLREHAKSGADSVTHERMRMATVEE